MDDFRIPVMSREVILEFPCGVQTAGAVFIPTAAPDHDGPMRLVEWLNCPDTFFPFKIHGEERSKLINRDNVLTLSAYHERDSGDFDEIDEADKRPVRVETLHGNYTGNMVIDMPCEKKRVLDVLNDDKRFIFLIDNGKEIHINKIFITGTVEIEGRQSAGTV